MKIESLSVGDVIGLIALLIGVIGVILTVVVTAMVPVVLRQRRDREQVRLVERNSARLDMMAELVSKAVSEVSAYCRFIAGLADSELSVLAPDSWSNLGQVLSEYEELLQKRVLELQVFSSDDKQRNEALVNLGSGLGDHQTERMLERLRSLADDPNADDPNLRKAIGAIVARFE